VADFAAWMRTYRKSSHSQRRTRNGCTLGHPVPSVESGAGNYWSFLGETAHEHDKTVGSVASEAGQWMATSSTGKQTSLQTQDPIS